jgi:predicted nucleotidyltransferase
MREGKRGAAYTQAGMRSNRITVVRHWIGDSERWLSTFLKTVSTNPAIVAVVVIGSAVRERRHRRSDFDLLVIYRNTRPAIEAPLEVDIRLVPLEGIDEQIARAHEVLCWAIKFGEPIYDPTHVWGNLQESWSNRVPLPSASQAMDRARHAAARAAEMLDAGDESAADDLTLAALTQFVRERLIRSGVFPASRPELPAQLRGVRADDPLAELLENTMYGTSSRRALKTVLKAIRHEQEA